MGSLPRPQDALRQPGRRRIRDADHGDVFATVAWRIRDRALPQFRCDRVRTGRRSRTYHDRRQDPRMGASRRLRRAELEVDRARAEDDAVLFSYSDRAAQRKLGFWREQRGDQ